MPFLRTTTLIDILKARLESLPLEPESPEKLFNRVGVFGANQLVEAMRATFAAEQRVAFIVPVGDTHAATRDRNVVYAQRTTKLVVLIADRAMDKARSEALVGGPRNRGILEMKDDVTINLTSVPFADHVDLAFVPAEGEPLMIQEDGKPAGNLGRECWAQHLTCYAGSARVVIP